MTLLSYFIKFIRKNIFLVIVLFFALVVRLDSISEIFPFDHDQQVPAEAAFDFFVSRRISLIGQELSFQGFFLGPLHNWIQFIPYGICSLKPDCVPYFYLIIGIATIIATYLVIKEIFNYKVAILMALLYGFSFTFISYEIGVNSNYFTYLSSLALLYCVFKYFRQKDYYLIIGAFIGGIATVNFNPIFVFTVIAFFMATLVRKSRSFMLFTFASGAFLINYFPLMLFNVRHDNLLGKSLKTFISGAPNTNEYVHKIIFNIKDISLSFYTNYFFQSTDLFFLILTVAILAAGAFLIAKSKTKFLLFVPIWVITVNLAFVFYSGPIPEYYFQQTLIPVALLAAIVFSRNIRLFVLFTSIFLFFNLIKLFSFESPINYQVKKQVINFIISDSSSETFNAYFDFPLGLNTGYDYLFKVNKKLPVEGGKNLYVVGAGPTSYFLKYRFQHSFPNKIAKEKIFNDFVRVVSVND